MKEAKAAKKIFILSADIPAFLLISAYVIFFGFISVLKYRLFLYDDQDLAIYAQTLYNILHGSIESSILSVPFLGNHLNLILFLVVPVYAIFKSPIVLLTLQTLALGLSGYPIYLIAKEELPEKFSLLVLFSYLLYPCLGYVNLYEFHIPALAAFFISAALYFMRKGRLNLFFIFVALILLCQENMPLIIVSLGIYLFIVRRPLKWWLPVILLGAVWFWAAVFKLIPYFGKGTIQFVAIYGNWGSSVGEVLKNILTEPHKLLAVILDKANLAYFCQVFSPVLFLPVLSPVTFLPAIPSVLQHLLSLRPQEHVIYYHYTAEIIPFVFFSAIFALKKILTLKFLRKYNVVLAFAFFAGTVGSNYVIGPHINYLLNPGKFFKADLYDSKNAFLKKIPETAEVVATFEFLPKLSGRRGLYSLQHVSTGSHTLSDVPYVLPATAEYAIVNFQDRLTFKSKMYNAESAGNLRHLFDDGNFGIVDMVEGVVLLRKNFKGDHKLYRTLPGEPRVSKKLSVVIDKADKDVELIGYDVDRAQAEKGRAPFKFYWRCLRDTDNIYGVTISVLDGKDKLIKEASRFICYKVYPTNEWREGQIIEEFYILDLPPGLPLETCRIKFDFFKARQEW